jgi:hypothetical protein
MESLDKLPKLRKMHMRFGMWNVRSLCRASSLMTVAKEIILERYKWVVWTGLIWLRIETGRGLL